MAWCLVTPASRGIGLALTRRLLQVTPPNVPIVATARSDLDGVKEQMLDRLSPDSKAESRLDLRQCDFDQESSISDLAAHCKDRYQLQSGENAAHLRLAMLLPGMLVPEKSPQQISADSALATLKLNLLAPMLLLKHLSPLLPKKSMKLSRVHGLNDAAMMALMSARVGSISDNNLGGWYSYRASKAGVAQLAKTLDNFLKMQSGDKAMSVGLHPGTVKTDLSSEFWKSTPKEKLFEPEFAAEKLVEVLQHLNIGNDRGKVWDWKGDIVPS